MKTPSQTAYQGKAQGSAAVEPLVPATKHFSDTISLNPDMAESTSHSGKPQTVMAILRGRGGRVLERQAD